MLQAQESGEQFEIQDNVVYALDGLTRSASPAVRQESAAKIAEVCASQRGRLAMRYATLCPPPSLVTETQARTAMQTTAGEGSSLVALQVWGGMHAGLTG